MSKIIYLKLEKKVNIIGKLRVELRDVAQIYGDKEIINKLQNLVIIDSFKSKGKNSLASLSAFYVIEKMSDADKDIQIENVGAQNVILCFKKKEDSNNFFITAVKVAIVSLTFLCGGAVAIMTFQTDAAVPDVFNQFYEIFLGTRDQQPYLIEVPYAIGVAVGITVFFNHIFSFKMTSDPTPIEVEMSSYEEDVNVCIVENFDISKR